MSKSNNNLPRSPHAKKDWTASSLSPISKLLGNRPTVVQSLVSKVEAISFEGIPPSDHHQQQQQQQHQTNLLDSASLSRPSSFLQSSSPDQGSPPISITSSPNLNEIGPPHLEEFVRDTPTIRQLKTSLRSRLQTDSDRHQKRFSEDSGRSDSTDHHQTPTSSPQQLKPASLRTASQNRSLPPSHINLVNKSALQKETLERSDHASQPGCDVSFGTSPTSSEQPIRSSDSTSRSRASTNLPDLRIPLINFNLSPPTIAIWSVEAYDREQKINFAEIVGHLIVLPFHTVLAIMNQLPLAGGHLGLNPLASQAEKDNQGILLTASRIAIGLVLASGWKVVRRILN
ncbi:hypothetical protein PtB15_3B2 [Puccinia triticina]|nr:hypothetical protein PtB15_3B2 [Puccinia triticina]